MPSLGLHLTAARSLAADLDSSIVETDRGAYYLGATTPDIRVLTKWDRAHTHFFDLNDFEAQDGVHRLFEQEPQLRDAAAVSAPTAAFMAGYISHLVLDEDYITQMYRPLFGEKSALDGEALANVMDRLLQWEMDRRDRPDPESCIDIQKALAETAVEVSIDFIARETLIQWRDVTVDIISHAPTWERFHRIASRHLAAAGISGEDSVAQFMEEAPQLLDRTLQSVGTERIHEYLHGAKSRALRAMKEYLK
jgi:hypothetical protein